MHSIERATCNGRPIVDIVVRLSLLRSRTRAVNSAVAADSLAADLDRYLGPGSRGPCNEIHWLGAQSELFRALEFSSGMFLVF